MTLAVRRSIASVGAATLLFSGGAVLLATHAGAATTPPWENASSQDANEVGTLALFNSAGTQVTSWEHHLIAHRGVRRGIHR